LGAAALATPDQKKPAPAVLSGFRADCEEMLRGPDCGSGAAQAWLRSEAAYAL